MPRPNKTVRRQKINAGIEYKKGNRKEAYQLWAKAADGRCELQAKKKKNQKNQETAEQPSDS
ncbi:MAG: hypothetical protein KAV82_16600 [Phycisphaerae bacterium]|nr:hypothetical protein [Phycisphaerae bacterium]